MIYESEAIIVMADGKNTQSLDTDQFAVSGLIKYHF